jgi:hypothetical protein
MAITFDNRELRSALDLFAIDEEDYYILFDTNVVYIVWCTKGLDALEKARRNDCVSIDVKGEWFYAQELPLDFKPDRWVCTRYILATN